MDLIKKKIDGWLNKPKANDQSLFARFYYADKNLTYIANELDSFDGRAEPERCSRLVGKLRQGQDKVLAIINQIMDELLGDDRACRAYRAKFPEEVLQESLAGQLWFGAECLAAGSSIMNREIESTNMRPLAKAVSKSLDSIRNQLREQCLRNNTSSSSKINLDINDSATEVLLENLKIFDRVFAEFEFLYVSAMVQVKSKEELEMHNYICVLFSETLQRALSIGLLTQEQVDSYDPALMFSIPRLAILAGLIYYDEGPLNVHNPVAQMSEMFKPFRKLLIKLRELLLSLSSSDLQKLEILLCTNEQTKITNENFDLSQHQHYEYEYKENSKSSQYYNETIFKLTNFRIESQNVVEDSDSIVGFLVSNTNLGNLLNLDEELLTDITRSNGFPSNICESGYSTGNMSVDNSPENELLYCIANNRSLDDKKLDNEKSSSHFYADVKSDKVPFTETLIHRLFVCIAGVADQLQTNFAADLRRILRIVFSMNIDDSYDIESNENDAMQEVATRMHTEFNIPLNNSSVFMEQDEEISVNDENTDRESSPVTSFNIGSPQNPIIQSRCFVSPTSETNEGTSQEHRSSCVLQAPKWIPDNDAPLCMNCAVPFHSFFRRRHHCRNCGGVFCNICSSLCTPLPKYGLYKAVRVCKDCFISESKKSE